MTTWTEERGSRPTGRRAAHKTTRVVSDSLSQFEARFEATMWAVVIVLRVVTVLSFVASVWSVLAGGSVDLAPQAGAVALTSAAVWLLAPRRENPRV